MDSAKFVDDATQDLAIAARTLLKSPSFAISAALILSLAIGLNVTLYQMVGAALLRPPAIRSASEVARFYRAGPHSSSSDVPYPVAAFVEQNNSVLAAVMVQTGSTMAWGPDAAEQIAASFVSTNWFNELGYGPLVGRVLSDASDRAADTPSVVLGYTFWQSSQNVDPEYFGVMRIPIVSGRVFDRGESGALVVSRRLALEMYGTLTVLGERFPKTSRRARSTASDVAELRAPEGTIVGVAADAHALRLTATDAVELYAPLKPADFSLVYLVARARNDAGRLPPILREAASIDPRALPTAHHMLDDFDRTTRGPRLASGIASATGVLTLALACLGIFGVVSYGVALRTKEIGIRLALGASRRLLVRAIIRHVLSPVAIGVGLGFVLAIPAGRALSGEPFYLQNLDAAAFVSALAILTAAAAVAAVWPALAMVKRNPIDTLRHQ